MWTAPYLDINTWGEGGNIAWCFGISISVHLKILQSSNRKVVSLLFDEAPVHAADQISHFNFWSRIKTIIITVAS